jgi:hypothetical protein
MGVRGCCVKKTAFSAKTTPKKKFQPIFPVPDEKKEKFTKLNAS